MKRVVITGLGTVNPLGNDVTDFWKNAIQGQSSAGKISRFDASQFRTQIACEIKNIALEKYLDSYELKRTDRDTLFALSRATQALQHGALSLSTDATFGIGHLWAV